MKKYPLVNRSMNEMLIKGKRKQCRLFIHSLLEMLKRGALKHQEK